MKRSTPRKPFPVTDDELDAPDGAVVDGYERQGDRWVPSATALAPVAPGGSNARGEPAAVLAAGAALVQSYLATLGSPRSVSTMTESFARVANVLDVDHYSEIPWAKLDPNALALIKRKLAASYPPATANLTLSAVRGLLKTGFLTGQVPHALLDYAKELGGVRGSRVTHGRALSDEEIGRLESATKLFKEPKASMLRGLLMIALGTGLRREEICTLPLSCVVGGELRIIGKGNKERSCPLDEPTKQHLMRWLDVRKGLDWPHRMLFASPSHGKPLSKQTLWWILRELAGRAEVKNFSPHDLRRTFASRLLDERLELREVQVLMGHASPQTTARYDKREPERIAERRRAVRVYVSQEDKTG